MKKLLSFLLSFILAASVLGCAQTNPEESTSNDKSETELTSLSEDSNSIDSDEAEETEVATSKSSDSKILVVYFSRTGNTEELALYAADYCNGDIFEIEAKEPYTDEDIDYNNSNSRASIEQNDILSRPEISNQVTNMDQYTMIILAYPIWFGQAPRIIYTFLESYDFSNKTIIPFCTSASSDIGTSDENLHELVNSNVIWVKGKRFAIGTSEETIVEWLNNYFY